MQNKQTDSINKLYDFAAFSGESVADDMQDIIEYLQDGSEDEQKIAGKTLVEVAIDAPQEIIPHILPILEEIKHQHIAERELAKTVAVAVEQIPAQTLNYHAEGILTAANTSDNNAARAWLVDSLRHVSDSNLVDDRDLSRIACECLENDFPTERAICVSYLNELLVDDPDRVFEQKEILYAHLDSDSKITAANAANILARACSLAPDKIDFERLHKTILDQLNSSTGDIRTKALESASLIVVQRPEKWEEYEQYILQDLAAESSGVRAQAGQAVIDIGLYHPDVIPNGNRIAERLRELNEEFEYEQEYGQEYHNLLDVLAELGSGGGE